MYFSTSIFLTALGTSLAYLPDPDNCCKSVKVKKSETSLINGEVFKLDNLKEYLVYEPCEYFSCEDFLISYDVKDKEWRVIWSSLGVKYSSNSTESCPEIVETWDHLGLFGDYLGVSEMKVVCYKPFYKKYWYVILIACLLVVVLCCCSYCGGLSKKNEKSENVVMAVQIMTVSTVLERT